ncbi:unnamed protein product [Trichobilharzia regenti]|nr:unnamed protein product [Trichobilharzia regenti]
MQKDRRKMRREGSDLLTIGYAVYKVSDMKEIHHCKYYSVTCFFNL